MRQYQLSQRPSCVRLLPVVVAVVTLLLAVSAQAAVPGITGPTFNLTASADFISQPDGAMIYSWGYGCTSAPSGFAPFPGSCPVMQIPGPTLIVTEGDTVTVTLTNKLPAAAGNTSLAFPGFSVTTTGGVPGLLAQEAAPNGAVTYTFVADKPGTHNYYSATRPDLQIEMGLFGALIVRPATTPAGCTKGPYSLGGSAYDHPATCYDREYLFQLSEMNLQIHQAVQAQAAGPGPIDVKTEPYRPNYFLVNGRSMPDDMDANYTPYQPHQPYNANPHIHPGELLLMRVIGVGRYQHPFHHHGNHARVLARDGNLILSQSDPAKLAGNLEFTVPSVSGQTVDTVFTWTGKGLNFDVYGHHPGDGTTCTPDANGYNTVNNPPVSMGYEYCPDHNKPIPVSAPDPAIVANGLWYGGSPYLGLAATTTSAGGTPLPPGSDGVNPNASYAFMWHSHDEREITTNDVFPGGMFCMLLVDAPGVTIDERK